MKHSREDYNRIQDPSGKIPEDEPVFLLRAQDEFAPAVVEMWAHLVLASGDVDLAEKAFEHAAAMQIWQIEVGCKRPDLPD